MPIVRLTLAAAFVVAALASAGATAAPAASTLPNVDTRARDSGPVGQSARRARRSLERELGAEGLVATDRVTGAARLVARTDGVLTGRSGRSAAAVALDYVRDRPDVFGLGAGDLELLRPLRRYRTSDGVTHLAYAQTHRGVAAYDNVLLANVDRDGRLLNVGGSAVAGLRVASVVPHLSAAAALAAAKRAVGGSLSAPRARQGAGPERATRFSNGDTAVLTLFNDGAQTRLAWRVELTGAHQVVYELVVDATSGRVLKRRSLTESAAARVYRNHPGAASGGTPELVNLASDPTWLNQSTPVSPKLSGNNAHAYVDADTTDVIVGNPAAVGPTGGDLEIPPSSPAPDWDYPIVPFNLAGCPPAPERCTWNAAAPSTRTSNRNQAATQLFFFVNTFHDHLAQAPIEFTSARGNFELAGAPGVGGDPVMAEVDNYLNPDEDRPTSTDNASMTTRRDGTPPRLEAFLFTNPSLNSADAADVIYHEYAHGLTNRSVGSGVGLDADQSRALGEGWSDWYALDYLVAQGLVTDSPASGELDVGAYLVPGGFRREGVDCPVASGSPQCPGTSRAGAGGFTLGDMGRVGSEFEVHDDGEIWGQTLWDLRSALGVATARRLITNGLRLSPNNPSFLEARDAILLADRTAGGPHYETLWSVFAQRGMGFSATTASSAATTAVEAFDLPPRLEHEATAFSDGAPGGDGDDVPEPGETISLTERLRNPHASPTTGISGLLTGPPSVTIGQPSATWPTIAGGLSGVNTTPFAFTVPAEATCDSTVQLSLAVTTDQGAGFAIPLRVPVGGRSSGDVPKVVPSGGTGGQSTLTFGGAGLVDDLEVDVARLAHTWVGDLVVTLRSPAGTTVTLMSRAGSGTDGAPGDDIVDLVFDDDAATPIDAIPDASPPGGYTGRYRPTEPLSGFDGEQRQGIWTLTVRDDFPGDDSGTLYDWRIRPSAAPPCPNRAPVAVGEEFAVDGGQSLGAGGVLANDSDPDGDPITAVKAGDPAHGTVTVSPDGAFLYTPAAGFRGTDSFTYRARDDANAFSQPATVTVSVGNTPPVASDDAYAATSSATLAGRSVLANDSDPNSDALSAELVSAPAHGTLTLASDGTFRYTSEASFTGRDAFVYRAVDGSAESAPATATITVGSAPVTPPPPPPVAPARAPAKIEVRRAGVRAGRLDVLAGITTRAQGRVAVVYRSAGATTRFSVPIARGTIRIDRRLPAAQRRKPTGIFTLSYEGSTAVEPDTVTLRAASGKARLALRTARIDARGRLLVSGSISPRARGAVRIRLGHRTATGTVKFLQYRAKVARGAWSLTQPLPAAAAQQGGQLSIQFTGYEPLLIRGEQLAKAVSGTG